MNRQNIQEDTHFFIDNAPPEEVKYVLRVLSAGVGLTPKEIADSLKSNYGFEMQDDKTYSPRRLFDLGLAIQSREGGKTKYRLTERGVKLQNILDTDSALAVDLLHYLHYTGYIGAPHDRKYLWSYRRCCEIIWTSMRKINTSTLATQIQSEMREEFPQLDYGARQGSRFNSTGVSRVYRWLRELNPSPLDEKIGMSLLPRIAERYELAILALDYIYQSRGYTYGDPVIMDDNFIQQVAGVFFLDTECCRRLLLIGARVTQSVKLRDTLAGSSINLLKPFRIENL